MEGYKNIPQFAGFQDGSFVTGDGVRLHYMTKGEGAPLVMLHGCTGDARDFMFAAPLLAEHFRVVILEHRGHGYSEKPDHGARIARLSKDLYEFLETLFPDTKVDILGYSMGCAVIWSYMDLFGQDKIRRAVFVDEAPFLWANPQDDQAAIDQYGGNNMDLWELANAFTFGQEPGKVFVKSFSRFVRIDRTPQQEERAKTQGATPDLRFFGALIRDHIALDWRDVIPRITVPSLLVSGDISHAGSVECFAWMQEKMADARWIRFTREDGGTHDLMTNAPEKFAAAVTDFLQDEH